MSKVSPSVAGVKGFQVAGVHAGLKKDGALDFTLIVSETDCISAGVFTRNKVKAAPVLLDMERLGENAEFYSRGGNQHDQRECLYRQCRIAERAGDGRYGGGALAIEPGQVMVMSTGVIGSHLPMEKDRAWCRVVERESWLGLAVRCRRHHDDRYTPETGFGARRCGGWQLYDCRHRQRRGA